jgi:hypothetical protein
MIKSIAGLKNLSKDIILWRSFSDAKGGLVLDAPSSRDQTPSKINNILSGQTGGCQILTCICRKCNGIED